MLDDRLQAVTALLGHDLQRDRVRHPPAPLVREQGQQARERQQRGGRGRQLVGRPGREQPDGGEQEVDEVGPGVGAQVVARVDADRRPQAQRGHGEVGERLGEDRDRHQQRLRDGAGGGRREREQQRGGEHEPRIADDQQQPQRPLAAPQQLGCP